VVPFGPGAVVLVRFPFSDLTRVKLRPAIVLANSGRGDWVLCQITSKTYGDSMAVQIEDASFQSGSLRLTSYKARQTIYRQHRLDRRLRWPTHLESTSRDR